MNTEIIYSLNTEDLQTVALQEIDRELTDSEIEKIKELIAEKINWYDAIADAISETFNEDFDNDEVWNGNSRNPFRPSSGTLPRKCPLDNSPQFVIRNPLIRN